MQLTEQRRKRAKHEALLPYPLLEASTLEVCSWAIPPQHCSLPLHRHPNRTSHYTDIQTEHLITSTSKQHLTLFLQHSPVPITSILTNLTRTQTQTDPNASPNQTAQEAHLLPSRGCRTSSRIVDGWSRGNYHCRRHCRVAHQSDCRRRLRRIRRVQFRQEAQTSRNSALPR